MLETPHIVHTRTQMIASIPLQVDWAEMRKVMGPGLAELRAAVTAQAIAVTGPWFNHHFRMPTDTFDFEICLPVASPVTPVGRVRASQLPAATVIRTVYQGNYEGLATAWAEFKAWVLAQGLSTGPDFWECYQVGPESGTGPESWRTELNWTLVGGDGVGLN